jgi:hypothetical protein
MVISGILSAINNNDYIIIKGTKVAELSIEAGFGPIRRLLHAEKRAERISQDACGR